jgi:hypothetical protein
VPNRGIIIDHKDKLGHSGPAFPLNGASETFEFSFLAALGMTTGAQFETSRGISGYTT